VSISEVMALPTEPIPPDRMPAMGYPGRDNSTRPLPAIDYAVPPSDMANLGRDKLPEWTLAEWERIDKAAVCEVDRASVATKFLPKVPSLSSSERTVAADEIKDADGVLSIDQSSVLPLLEEAQLFLLSKEQYYEEAAIGTAATLASRAANRLARAMDEEIFNGTQNPSLVSVAKKQKIEKVKLLDPAEPGVYGENLFKSVAAAYAHLQGKNLYGPYALALPANEYADAHAPLKTTLIMPADRIRPLMTAGFYATGTLPNKRGVMVSLGGTVDVAIAVHGATAFTQVDNDENRRFRVYERFTLRIKVPEALVLLEFE
jgi:uncharacterized linocin/CFP29 family protein